MQTTEIDLKTCKETRKRFIVSFFFNYTGSHAHENQAATKNMDR